MEKKLSARPQARHTNGTRPPVADGTIRHLVARAVADGRGVEVLLGADVLDDGGFFLPSEARSLLEYAEWLVRRDAKDAGELLAGCAYSWPDEPRAPFTVRVASLEEMAAAAARRLRSARGHTLRRVDAQHIADILSALVQRSAMRRAR